MQSIIKMNIVIILLLLAGCARQPIMFQAEAEHSASQQLANSYCFQYLYGDHLRGPDYQRAQSWCRRGAESGNAHSQALLAEMYLFGLAMPVNVTLAQRWYRNAADQGHLHASYMLYQFYRQNMGDIVSKEQAHHWLQLAAEGGHAQAQELLVLSQQTRL